MAFGGEQPGAYGEQRIVARSRHLNGNRNIVEDCLVIAHRQVRKRGGASRHRPEVGAIHGPRAFEGTRGLIDRTFEVALTDGHASVHDSQPDSLFLARSCAVDGLERLSGRIKASLPELTP